MSQGQEAHGGPPYISTSIATVGGHPNVNQDIPVCAILIFIYFAGAMTNMSTFQLNRRTGHRFLMSLAMFGFCMSRVVTCALRIAWAASNHPKVALAAQIFTNAGVLIIYVVVLLLSLRVFRATHPKLGWKRPLGNTLKVSYFLLLIAILLTIAFTIVSLYTLHTALRSAALWIQRAAILYMMLFNVMSTVLLLLSIALPRAPDSENFGSGSIGPKLVVLGVAVFFSIFIAGFRTANVWSAPRPASNPAWYHTKAAFYVILFGFEIIIVYLFLFTRFDRTFWVPNGSKKAGDYSKINISGSTERKTSEQAKNSQISVSTGEKTLEQVKYPTTDQDKDSTLKQEEDCTPEQEKVSQIDIGISTEQEEDSKIEIKSLIEKEILEKEKDSQSNINSPAEIQRLEHGMGSQIEIAGSIEKKTSEQEEDAQSEINSAERETSGEEKDSQIDISSSSTRETSEQKRNSQIDISSPTKGEMSEQEKESKIDIGRSTERDISKQDKVSEVE